MLRLNKDKIAKAILALGKDKRLNADWPALPLSKPNPCLGHASVYYAVNQRRASTTRPICDQEPLFNEQYLKSQATSWGAQNDVVGTQGKVWYYYYYHYLSHGGDGRN